MTTSFNRYVSILSDVLDSLTVDEPAADRMTQR